MMKSAARTCALLFLNNHLQTASCLKTLQTCTFLLSSKTPVSNLNYRTFELGFGLRDVVTCNNRHFSTLPNSVNVINTVDETSSSIVTESTHDADLTNDNSGIAPYVLPAFNLAAYVNNSYTLQELVKLGVDLHKLEKKKGIPQFILKLDFKKDIAPHLRLLSDVGVPSDQLGTFLTKNPLIFKEEIDDLQVRLNYLHSKQFSSDMIVRVVEHNPHWLMFSTQRIDRRLGYFQKSFALTGSEVRQLATKQPRLITYSIPHIKLMTFGFKEEMGFTDEEVKCLLLGRPKLWMMNETSMLQKFNFVHNEMKIPHEQITKQPQVLGSRVFRTKQRHLFLTHFGRAQYDPKLPGYVSLDKLVAGTDGEFALDVAKSNVHTFNLFLKTL